MNGMRFLSLTATLVLATALALACGPADEDTVDDRDDPFDDDDDEDNPFGDDYTTTSTTTTTTTTTSTTTTTIPHILYGHVLSYPADNPVPTAQVELIDDVTGYPFVPEIKTFTDTSGGVRFDDLPFEGGDRVGVRVKGDGYVDTYEYHFVVGSTNQQFRVAEETLVKNVDLYLGDYDIEAGRGIISGGVYWRNEDGVEEAVGCAVVDINIVGEGSSGDLFYFNWIDELELRLPVTNRTTTTPGYTPPLYGSKPLSLFIDINADPGPHTVGVTMNYGIGETVTLKLPYVCEDCFVISRVVTDTDDFAENPTPEGCE
ncbi:MAG: hypothetical protein H6685_11395 [Deltaproteobacteria bacterium]|nr:hypothetical protein [Deltaproteobacteria bacterium]